MCARAECRIPWHVHEYWSRPPPRRRDDIRPHASPWGPRVLFVDADARPTRKGSGATLCWFTVVAAEGIASDFERFPSFCR